MSDKEPGIPEGIQFWSSGYVPADTALVLDLKALKKALADVPSQPNTIVMSPRSFGMFTDVMAFERAWNTLGFTGPRSPITICNVWRWTKDWTKRRVWNLRSRLGHWILGDSDDY